MVHQEVSIKLPCRLISKTCLIRAVNSLRVNIFQWTDFLMTRWRGLLLLAKGTLDLPRNISTYRARSRKVMNLDSQDKIIQIAEITIRECRLYLPASKGALVAKRDLTHCSWEDNKQPPNGRCILVCLSILLPMILHFLMQGTTRLESLAVRVME